jgi:CRISPR-associated endonuclease/helicase Cas3
VNDRPTVRAEIDRTPTAATLWAKLRRNENKQIVGWHSLLDHSADVAAVVEALLAQPTITKRLAKLAGYPELDAVTRTHLAALAFLHDIGKTNRGFRARVDQSAPLVGHIDQLAWVFDGDNNEDVQGQLVTVLGLDRMESWFGDDRSWWGTVFAHHGRPWRVVPSRAHWRRASDDDPVADLAPIRAGLDRWFADAFADGPTLPDRPGFQHAFAGLLMLADWLGSDSAADAFPFANGGCEDRMAFARRRAAEVLAAIGLVAEPSRSIVCADPPDFRRAFGRDPRPLQQMIAEPNALCVVLESETGSGKTEAALWRWLCLFLRDLVDGIYFALPTRVAATMMFERVRAFRDRVWGTAGPAVIRAVPGQIGAETAEGRALPDFGFAWDDEPDNGARRARWAAEHPKRFLAAPIAVGTIDQALLAAVNVRHAHMRGAALLRNLLVVDEVHASDAYMGGLLTALLRAHTAAGGHALLLSATLGGGLRAKLLGTPQPDFAAATAADYPALGWMEDGRERRLKLAPASEDKHVVLRPAPWIDDADAIAAAALRAAADGAKVLVVRNTVAGAVRVAQALELQAGAEHSALFRVRKAATLHHGRFAAGDRRLLDEAAQTAIGPERRDGGFVIVGTQTLEQSLDLDADLLLTDLCPIDVLLQRIGRLHRHERHGRPAGFEKPQAIILTPAARELATLIPRPRNGLGRFVYEDLRIIEATWRQIEAQPRWTIPTMNRVLLERATHPDSLSALLDELAAQDPRWTEHFQSVVGKQQAELDAAHGALLPRTRPFDEWRIPEDEWFSSRLGGADLQVAFAPGMHGPFNVPPGSLKLPHYLLDGTEETEIADVAAAGGAITFRLGMARFIYDRWGLQRPPPLRG